MVFIRWTSKYKQNGPGRVGVRRSRMQNSIGSDPGAVPWDWRPLSACLDPRSTSHYSPMPALPSPPPSPSNLQRYHHKQIVEWKSPDTKNTPCMSPFMGSWKQAKLLSSVTGWSFRGLPGSWSFCFLIQMLWNKCVHFMKIHQAVHLGFMLISECILHFSKKFSYTKVLSRCLEKTNQLFPDWGWL